MKYNVIGIDFSADSIRYATDKATKSNSDITYLCQDYLSMDYEECFDLVTLIYCDFGVLSTSDRKSLLSKIKKALRPGGKFIFDVFTPKQHEGKEEKRSWEFYKSGFWSSEPHLLLDSFYRYDEDETVLNQYIIISENNIDCYKVWEHCFTEKTLKKEINEAGFHEFELYNDISGSAYSQGGTMICAVLTK